MEAESSPGKGASRHPRIVAALLIVATLLTFVAIFSVWINRQALNTDNWVNTSDKLLQNKDVQSQLSIFLADQLFAGVDVQAELQKSLPPRLQPLAGPASGALHQLAPQVAQRALATPQFQTLWSQANRAAHETLLKIVDGSGGGQVTLDLGSLVKQIGSQLGGSGAIASKIPPNAGQLTVLKSSQISTVQKIAKLIRRLPIVLTLLVLLLYGLAIYLAGPRRRQALRSVGFGFIVAGAVVLIVRGIAGGYVVDGLTKAESVRPAAQAVWSIGTSLLVTVASSALAFGILTVIGAWLAGPTRPAMALRREASPYLREHRGGAYAAAAVVWLALIGLAPIAAFRKPLGILFFALLFAVGTEIFRRQALREFPETEGGGLGERMRETGRQFSTAAAGTRVATVGPGAGAAGAAAASPEDAELDRLERLSALHKDGTLTDEEFEARKRQILGGST